MWTSSPASTAPSAEPWPWTSPSFRRPIWPVNAGLSSWRRIASATIQFRDFFVRAFHLDAAPLAHPGYLRAPSGGLYELVFVGRSGEPFPSGVEVNAIIPAFDPLDEDTVDRNLWAILRWMIDGVGPPWTVADLEATGRLYRIPAARELTA